MKKGIVRAVFFIVPTSPPTSFFPPPFVLSSPPSNLFPGHAFYFFYQIKNEKVRKHPLFLRFFLIDCREAFTFVSPQLLIVLSLIDADSLDFSFCHMCFFSSFSFLYFSFLAVSRYLCCVVIVCLPVVIFLSSPPLTPPTLTPPTLLFMIIIIYFFLFVITMKKKT